MRLSKSIPDNFRMEYTWSPRISSTFVRLVATSLLTGRLNPKSEPKYLFHALMDRPLSAPISSSFAPETWRKYWNHFARSTVRNETFLYRLRVIRLVHYKHETLFQRRLYDRLSIPDARAKWASGHYLYRWMNNKQESSWLILPPSWQPCAQ